MCRTYGLDVVNCDVTWGEGVPLEDYRAILETDKNHLIKAVLVCHNETATGVTSDVAGVRTILDDLNHPALLFVDGVSSVGSLDFRMDEWGVDVIVSGSQKGFMLPTGLAIVGVSQKPWIFAKPQLPQRLLLLHQHVANEQTRIFPIHSADDFVAWFARIHRHDER